jgi:hypothetical protein
MRRKRRGSSGAMAEADTSIGFYSESGLRAAGYGRSHTHSGDVHAQDARDELHSLLAERRNGPSLHSRTTKQFCH